MCAGVTDKHVGDEVFGVAPGCLGHTAFAPCETLVQKPRMVAFEEAATAPTVYCTAFTAFANGLSPSSTVGYRLARAAAGFCAELLWRIPCWTYLWSPLQVSRCAGSCPCRHRRRGPRRRSVGCSGQLSAAVHGRQQPEASLSPSTRRP